MSDVVRMLVTAAVQAALLVTFVGLFVWCVIAWRRNLRGKG